MRFADPHICPDCRGALAGQPVCPHCRLNLASAEVRQLWQTLLQADQLLAQATRTRDFAVLTPPPVAPYPHPYPARPAPAPYLPPPPPVGAPYAGQPQPLDGQTPPAPPAQRQWSVGTILLALGAFGLIVAGFIFVTRSWGELGLLGRTLVLSGVTAGFAALGVWVTRRPLRGSAEAVWTVVLALLTLDFFAARHEGMLGLAGMSVPWAWVVWGAALVGLGLLIALLSRKPVGADLVAPTLVAGIGIAIAGIGAGAVADGWELSWRSILALVVAGLLALATRPARLGPLTIMARVVVAGFFAWSYVVAAVDLLDHPHLDELVRDGHGLPMLLMAVTAVVVGWVVRPVRIWAVALAVVAVSALIGTPAAEAWRPEGLLLAIAALAAVLAVAAARGRSDWLAGVRVGAVPTIAALLIVHLVLLADLLGAVGAAIDQSWSRDWDARFDAVWVEDGAPWVVPLAVVALLVVAWFVPRWPELAKLSPQAPSLVAGAAGMGALDVVAAELPLWAAVAILLLVAGGLVAARVRGLATFAGPISAVLVVAAAALALSNQGVSAAAWIAGALVLAGLALAKGADALRQAYAVGGVVLVVAGLVSAADLVNPPHAVPALVGVIASLALLVAAGLVLRDAPVRLAVEAASAVAMLVALVSAGSTAEAAVRWTIVGVVVFGLSFAVPRRRWYLWPGAAALVVAYVLLIVDSGFSFVEAYTLPLGAAALAVGLYLVRRQPAANTWLLLGPGLAMALLPSLPQALADPTHLRALLLGLGAVVALALGIRFDWQAPFVLGVTIFALLVLGNLGPYANAAPRVVLIAAVSAILLGLGITWEDRVRDGRKLIGYVRAMR